MKQIDILCVGKLREKFFADAASEYEKRLKPYCTLAVTEVRDAEKLTARIDDEAFVIALDVKGERYDSEAFAAFLKQLQEDGKRIQFLIGEADGLSKESLAKSNARISLSDLTFPHQMARVILLEQIYRSYRIRNGEPYHK